MTISSREKQVPIELPAARLYLDDIEEIRAIILDAAASRALRPEVDPTQHKVETEFYVGDQVCTEIQDLPKIKKRTRDFEMRLSAPDGFSARFGLYESFTLWSTNGLTKADTWRAFHKLETVFERRRIHWVNLLLLRPVAFFLPRHGTVILRYSWEQAAQREERNAKIFIAAASALIAFSLGVVSMVLKRKYLP